MQGISRRELAKRFEISESTVRRHIDSGALADSFLRDGSLDPKKAAEALGKSLSGAKVIPRELVDARARRLRIQSARLADEVAHLRATSILPKDARAQLAREAALIRRHVGTIPDTAKALAGLPAAEVLPALKNIIFDALESHIQDKQAQHQWWDEPMDPQPPDFTNLVSNALLAKKTDLAAERLEILHALERGELVRVDEVVAGFEEKVVALKSALFALPGRVAHAIEAATPDEVRSLVSSEVEEALRELR